MEEPLYTERKEDKKKADGPHQFTWKQFLSANFINDKFVKAHWRFMLFLFALSVIYISNRHIFARTIRENSALRREVAKSKAKYITKSAELVRLKKRSQILLEIERRNINLEESKTPPQRVKE